MRDVVVTTDGLRALTLGAGLLAAAGAAHAANPWADSVVSFDAGSSPTPGFDDPASALGSPERFTGEGSGFPSVVSPFSPAFGADELVSIGEGGALTLGFDEPIADDPANPFGVDLILFGNGGFVGPPVGDPPGAFGLDEAQVSVSADGDEFVSLGSVTEGLYPAMGYQDTGAFDSEPGEVPTDFTTPVDPSLELQDFAGDSLADIREAYAGSGGGTPIDLAGSGLSSASFVRISVPDDADPDTSLSAEVEALATVPSPSSLALLGIAGLGSARRRR